MPEATPDAPRAAQSSLITSALREPLVGADVDLVAFLHHAAAATEAQNTRADRELELRDLGVGEHPCGLPVRESPSTSLELPACNAGEVTEPLQQDRMQSFGTPCTLASW